MFFLVCGAVVWRGFPDVRPGGRPDPDREACERVARLAHDDPAERDRAAKEIEDIGLDFQYAVFRLGQSHLEKRLSSLLGSRAELVGHEDEGGDPDPAIPAGQAPSNPVRLELYDVKDLFDSVTAKTQHGFTPLDFINLIKSEVRPKEWEEADGRSLRYSDGILIVRNLPSVQRELRTFLRRFRGAASGPGALASRPSVAPWIERLSEREAEERLAALARRFHATLSALEEGSRSQDAELRGRAVDLSERIKGYVRRVASHDLLRRAAIEALRDRWKSHNRGRFEDAIRSGFAGCEIESLRLVTEVRIGESATDLRQETVDALNQGDGIVRLESDRPAPAVPGESLAPPGTTLLFTLPEGKAWKAYVAVCFKR
jgi:hypothetical protein